MAKDNKNREITQNEDDYFISIGKYFSAAVSSGTLSAGTPYPIIIKVGPASINLKYVFSGSGQLVITAGPQYTGGTVKLFNNNNTDFGFTYFPRTSLVVNPTVTNDGFLAYDYWISSTSKDVSSEQGQSAVVLKANTDYMVRITNDTNGARVGYQLGYHEVEV